MEDLEQDQVAQHKLVQLKSSNTIWAVVVTAILVAVLVGGGMYMSQLKKVKNLEKQLNQVNMILTTLASKSVISTEVKDKVVTSSEMKKEVVVKTISTSQYTKKLINTNSDFDTYVVLDSDGIAIHDAMTFGESFANNILLDKLGIASRVEVTTSTNPYDANKVITYTVSYYDGLVTGSFGTTITSTKYNINKGLNIGVTQDKVWEVLGPPSKIHQYKTTKIVKYMYGEAGTATTFTFDYGKLIKIEYGGYRG